MIDKKAPKLPESHEIVLMLEIDRHLKNEGERKSKKMKKSKKLSRFQSQNPVLA